MYSYGPPTYGQAKAGRPARTYIQQLCEDTGCNPEDLPEVMNDREKWREMVRAARHDHDDDIYIYIHTHTKFFKKLILFCNLIT